MAGRLRCIADTQAVLLQHGTTNGCSDIPWAERVARVLPRESPVTLVNVGANKGYKVPEFLALWSEPGRRIEGYNQGWQRHLLEYARQLHSGFLTSYNCGNCADCRAKPPLPHNRSHQTQIHLLEIAPANQRLLRWMIERTRLTDVVTLHALGGSNVTSRLPIMKSGLPGDERHGVLVGAKQQRFARANATVHVDVVALDDFLEQQKLERLYHVAIDTEGFDALVLEGMRGAISRRKVSLVEFEVSSLGFWSPFTRGHRTVEDVIALFEAAQYACFWVLPSTLLPASGACLPPRRRPVKWSNIVCAHEPPVVAELMALSEEGYEARRAGGAGAGQAGRARGKRKGGARGSGGGNAAPKTVRATRSG